MFELVQSKTEFETSDSPGDFQRFVRTTSLPALLMISVVSTVVFIVLTINGQFRAPDHDSIAANVAGYYDAVFVIATLVMLAQTILLRRPSASKSGFLFYSVPISIIAFTTAIAVLDAKAGFGLATFVIGGIGAALIYTGTPLGFAGVVLVNSLVFGALISNYPAVSMDNARSLIFAATVISILLAFVLDRARKASYANLAAIQQNLAELSRSKAELMATNRKLQKAMDAKSDFLAHMSHELRTPLNAIIGFSDVLRGSTDNPISDKTKREYAGYIHSSGQGLLAIINDILDLTKIDAGQYLPDPSRLNMANLVLKVCRELGSLFDKRNQKIAIDLGAGLPDIMADETMLRKVLVNLLSNANKFTPEGGRITVSLAAAGDDYLRVQVQDTGISMSPEEIAIVTQPFVQVQSVRQRSVEGTGLGLAIVSEILGLHGTSLEISSEKGSGTTIGFRISVDEALNPDTIPSANPGI